MSTKIVERLLRERALPAMIAAVVAE